jgi:hypothetical protein
MARNGGGNRRGTGRGGNRRNGQMAQRKNAAVTLPNHLVLRSSFVKPYMFSRSFDFGQLPISAADTGFAFPFNLTQVPGSSDFTNLFDRYRINKIDVTFTLVVTPNTVFPVLNIFMDDDDATIPTTKASVMERQAVQRAPFSVTRQTVSVSFEPRWVQSRTTLAGTTANLAPRKTWIDMATPGVPHFGIKGWTDYYSSGNGGMLINVAGKMHFECASVR